MGGARLNITFGFRIIRFTHKWPLYMYFSSMFEIILAVVQNLYGVFLYNIDSEGIFKSLFSLMRTTVVYQNSSFTESALYT